jgi:hypothetical protein
MILSIFEIGPPNSLSRQLITSLKRLSDDDDDHPRASDLDFAVGVLRILTDIVLGVNQLRTFLGELIRFGNPRVFGGAGWGFFGTNPSNLRRGWRQHRWKSWLLD